MPRAVVVGGGVVGLCSAYSLAEKGFEVTVVDPGDGPSTSSINAGMIVPSHIIPLAAPGMVGVGLRMMLRPKSPLWIRPRLDRDLLRWGLRFARSCTKEHVERSKKLLIDLNKASKQGYLDFEKLLDGFHVEQKGLLMIARRESSLEEESHVAAQVRELGLPAEVLDVKQIREIDPGIRIDAVGGVHYVADCHFSPGDFMTALRSKLGEVGVRFQRDRVRDLSDRPWKADAIILAAGAWSNRLAAPLGLYLPLQAGKGYSFNVDDPPERPQICAILMEGRVAVTPMQNGVRFGGTMEIGPTDDRIDDRRVQGIREAIPAYYPAFQNLDLRRYPASLGLRPCSPDGLPYIGRTRFADNVIVATGHAMMGMSLGPITGRLVAQLASGESPEIDLHLLNPDRFTH
ncbi:MAG TPA: FAD-dependent oxidoreductase [Fimbriimonadaceae bacterium]|nr:FAD-dependent oxidoreductase [Fimbriimonadaceae bacterium]